MKPNGVFTVIIKSTQSSFDLNNSPQRAGFYHFCGVFPFGSALAHPEFRTGDVDTGLIGRDGDAMAQPPQLGEDALASAAASLTDAYDAPGFRLNAAPRTRAHFLLNGEPVEAQLSVATQPDHEKVDAVLVAEQGAVWTLEPWRADAAHGASAADGAILAPMPGKVIAVDVAQGDTVSAGQKLVTLEAMKMEHSLTAPFDGTVTNLSVSPGAQVEVEAVLAIVEPDTE